MHADAVDAVDDEAADDADADGQKRDNDADGDVPEDDRGARLPDKVKNRGNIPERAQPIAPGARRLLRSLGLCFAGFAGNFRIINRGGH